MYSLRSSLALAPIVLCSLLFVGPQQDGRRPDERQVPDRDTWPWTEIGDADKRRMLRDLQGAWRLTTLLDPNMPSLGRKEVGYALVVDEYMSIEIHVGFVRPGQPRPRGMIRTGMHHISLGPGSRMELESIIGSYLDKSGKTIAEQPGAIRGYELTVTPNLFTLDRLDGYQVTFQRMEHSRPRRDIFGRPIPERSSGEKR